MGDGHENTAVATRERSDYNKEAVDLIKQTVANGATDAELALFLYTAKRTGLDPLLKQIYCVKRWNNKEQRETMAIQTGIDGYRLIASRTGELAGIDDPLYKDESGIPISATVTVYRRASGQSKDSYTATARWAEYVQKGRNGEPTSMWAKMPFLMLGKCAESLALRKAFPAELSGLYTHDEMQQADNEPKPLKISDEAKAQVAETEAAVHTLFGKDTAIPSQTQAEVFAGYRTGIQAAKTKADSQSIYKQAAQDERLTLDQRTVLGDLFNEKWAKR